MLAFSKYPRFPSSLAPASSLHPLRCVQAPNRKSTARTSTRRRSRPSLLPPNPPLPHRPPLKLNTPCTCNPRIEHKIKQAYRLASSSGALGRGVRATLRAFYRRASFVLASSPLNAPGPLYVEIGPAYVLATARMGRGCERVTRYAVEQKAWPRLRELFGWEETTSTAARQKGAVLRRLNNGRRYGRHLFMQGETLAAILQVAEEVVEVMEERQERGVEGGELYKGLGEGGDTMINWADAQAEAIVEMKRRPEPGGRTVAATCPRGHMHANMDRKPSLILWMNSDGITGGAMCPVCVERDGRGGWKNMTWRVHYLPENSAVLCTPARRIRSPARVEKALEQYQNGMREKAVLATEQFMSGRPGVESRMVSAETLNSLDVELDDCEKENRKHLTCNEHRTIIGAVGGCVMRDSNQVAKVGDVIGMAYVTASLRIGMNANTTDEVSWDGSRQRTVGSMARQSCPMQVLLWSEKRSRGPLSSKKVEEVAWFAQQSVSWSGDDFDEHGLVMEDVVESEEWLPTPLLSVSAMKPTSWRDVTSANGRLISVPASWEASAQAWVLFDIDDIEFASNAVVEDAGKKVSMVVRREIELSGRCLVVRTGPRGMHIWAELREVRGEPGIWFKKEETRNWYAGVGDRLLQAAYRAGAKDGFIDMSSCAAGRFARRPSWRLLEDGTQFRSHIVLYVPSRVRSRIPRIPKSNPIR
eukprot:GFKZ01002554.1.p1 GENE.GFKZ01002554.1~~GFKZ01002554.1.p1  ORF type:complete len:701 (-),score=62.12 GFKZ01002554.1:251-2353(-)